MKRRNDSVKRLAFGSSLAALAGFLAGVLTAPKSGRKTRNDLKAATIMRRKQTEKELKKLHTELGDLIGEVKDKGNKLSNKTSSEAKTLLEKAADTKEKVREVISALHEGDADDQDLKRAISSAQIALEHLKDFLKK